MVSQEVKYHGDILPNIEFRCPSIERPTDIIIGGFNHMWSRLFNKNCPRSICNPSNAKTLEGSIDFSYSLAFNWLLAAMAACSTCHGYFLSELTW